MSTGRRETEEEMGADGKAASRRPDAANDNIDSGNPPVGTRDVELQAWADRLACTMAAMVPIAERGPGEAFRRPSWWRRIFPR